MWRHGRLPPWMPMAGDQLSLCVHRRSGGDRTDAGLALPRVAAMTWQTIASLLLLGVMLGLVIGLVIFYLTDRKP